MEKGINSFRQRNTGATIVEYALLVALVVGVCIATIYALGPYVNGAFVMSVNSMNASGTGP